MSRESYGIEEQAGPTKVAPGHRSRTSGFQGCKSRAEPEPRELARMYRGVKSARRLIREMKQDEKTDEFCKRDTGASAMPKQIKFWRELYPDFEDDG